ncbi:MAG: ATP-dependent RecD-like DNA helicase [Verrucomicrobiota bacterium]|nr:ATP-dependent RecD-like DNA helicase [Verrucomicrobiota bacterium]
MPAPTKSMYDSLPTGNMLRGVLERIIYFNEETQFCIGELRTGAGGEPIVITGALPNVQCGETLNLTGEWTRHVVHGPQFKFTEFRSMLPATVYGIRKYLGSGLVPGIGKHFANKIVDQFGEETLRIISEESGRLREVAGIGAKRAREIKKAWDEQKALRDVMMFLQTYGVTTGQCLRLVKHYGLAARETLQTNPYNVAREIDGIGFKTADRIALNLGFANDSAERLDAGILFAMQELEDDGHTGYPPEELQRKAAEMLGADAPLIAARLTELTKNRSVRTVEGSPLVQLPAMEFAETKISERLALLASQPIALPPIKVDAAISWAQERAGFAFAPEQETAVRAGLTEKFSIITGGPGTGKTTILRALVDILKAKKARILLASPTGRASQRLTETTGHFAQTLHRLLRFDPLLGKFTADESAPLSCDFIVIDESSMLDTRLAAALFRAIPARASVVLVGDVHQLPSVGPGNVLKDLIACQKFAVTTLTHIFRQKQHSGIVSTAHAILEGRSGPPQPCNSLEEIRPEFDLNFIKADTAEAAVETIVRLCRDFIPRLHPHIHPIDDVQVLAPMHRGTAGIAAFNKALQEALNPQSSGIPFGSSFFHKGDKVIQTVNSYDKGIFNGDLGRVSALNHDAGTLAVKFDEQTEVDYERADLSELSPAFAISIHKSQGSEFPVVVIPLLKQHFMMLQRNLLYTAITRGKKKVYIVGDTAAYSMAVRNSESAERKTDLERKIRELLP